MLVSLKNLLDHAAENNYAIPAFNINNLEQIKSVMEAASITNSPVILQTSLSANKYAGKKYLQSLLFTAVKQYPKIPICIHLDHGPTPDICYEYMKLGYSSVMIDGSLKEDMKTPSSIEYNINVTKKTVSVAHALGISVEGELGCLGSLENKDLKKKILLTNPREATYFVKETNVDALAIAIGTSHGAYKFKKPPSQNTLATDIVKKINKLLPNTHLVLHGASQVPDKLLNIINNNHGDIPKTFGVPMKDIKNIINFGIRKINIDTDLRLAATGAIRQYLKKNKSIFDIRKYNAEAIIAMKNVCIEKFNAFKTSYNADKVKV